jgi:hypothetical protein
VEPAPVTVPVAHATPAVVVAVLPVELLDLLLPHAPATTAMTTTSATIPVPSLLRSLT